MPSNVRFPLQVNIINVVSFFKMNYLDAAFPLASLLATLTSSFEEKEITPEMIELAKFTKQHIP